MILIGKILAQNFLGQVFEKLIILRQGLVVMVKVMSAETTENASAGKSGLSAGEQTKVRGNY